MAYADNTSVPVERSRAEIERIVSSAGADAFSSGWRGDDAAISFRLRDRYVRFTLTVPKIEDCRFDARDRYGNRMRQTDDGRRRKHDQERRRLWRCLLLVIKGKCEAVASGIVTFEQEFLPYIVLPDGRTLAEAVVPAIDEAYRTGAMPTTLLLTEGNG